MFLVLSVVHEDKGDSREERILGLNRTVFGVITAAVIFAILVIIIFVIYRCIKRHRTHRKFTLRTRTLDRSDHKAQRVSFRPFDANSDEEIDLNNESIRLTEEIKLQP